MVDGFSWKIISEGTMCTNMLSVSGRFPLTMTTKVNWFHSWRLIYPLEKKCLLVSQSIKWQMKSVVRSNASIHGQTGYFMVQRPQGYKFAKPVTFGYPSITDKHFMRQCSCNYSFISISYQKKAHMITEPHELFWFDQGIKRAASSFFKHQISMK